MTEPTSSRPSGDYPISSGQGSALPDDRVNRVDRVGGRGHVEEPDDCPFGDTNLRRPQVGDRFLGTGVEWVFDAVEGWVADRSSEAAARAVAAWAAEREEAGQAALHDPAFAQCEREHQEDAVAWQQNQDQAAMGLDPVQHARTAVADATAAAVAADQAASGGDLAASTDISSDTGADNDGGDAGWAR